MTGVRRSPLMLLSLQSGLCVTCLVILPVMMLVTMVAPVGGSGTVSQLKCCPSGQGLVRRAGQPVPTCAPLQASSAERWPYRTGRRHHHDLGSSDTDPLSAYTDQADRRHRSDHLRPYHSDNSDPYDLPDPSTRPTHHVSDPPSLVNANLTCARGHFWLTSDVPGQTFSLLHDGSLRWGLAVYPPGGHCADLLTSEMVTSDLVTSDPMTSDLVTSSSRRMVMTARICQLNLLDRSRRIAEAETVTRCAQTRCLRKCCPEGFLVRRGDLTCVPAAARWQPAFHHGETRTPEGDDFSVVSGVPVCRSPGEEAGRVFTLEPNRPSSPGQRPGEHPRQDPREGYGQDPDEEPEVEDPLNPERFFLQEDGRLWSPGQATMVPAGRFCVDRVVYDAPPEDDQSTATTATRDNRNTATRDDQDAVLGQIAVLCFPRQTSVPRPSPPPLLVSLQACSVAGLLAVLLIHLLVPALRNQHGRCLVSHSAALLVAFSCLLAATQPAVYDRIPLCQAVGEYVSAL